MSLSDPIHNLQKSMLKAVTRMVTDKLPSVQDKSLSRTVGGYKILFTREKQFSCSLISLCPSRFRGSLCKG